ncbi:MAG TPA: amidohydrolase family protein, partial [Afifellaceae bacterium]|nr:amidohydrolase family protein [Afifellaceae bacterium]
YDLPFLVVTQHDATSAVTANRRRELPVFDAPDGRLVIRARRFFDGTGDDYRYGLDIVIEGGRILALEAPRDRSGTIVVDMGDLTALPGFVDGYAALPPVVAESLGAVLLSYGVTTMLVMHPDVDALDRRWSGKDSPGPRLLAVADIGLTDPEDTPPWLVTIGDDPATAVQHRSRVEQWQSRGIPVVADNWRVAFSSGAAILLGAESLPVSPRGQRYADMRLLNGAAPLTIVSVLADARTSGLDSLLESRQAALAGRVSPPTRRFAEPPRLPAGLSIVAGSQHNRLPPGIALQAELRALVDAGLSPAQALRAAGSGAAAALGLEAGLGQIGVGSPADLVLVDGDPLGLIADAAKIVGIVRNGRFFSAIGLIERARPAPAVE